MEQIKKHIISFLSIMVVLAVLFPSIVKMQHVFENHKHEVCKGEKQAHFHEVEFDCEFYKFNINQVFQIENNSFQLLSNIQNHQLILSQYFFISEYQQLGISLRGPPQLV
jgi:hypothetical protein